MDHSYELLRAMEAYEVRESGEGLDSIPDAGVEMSFSDTKLADEMDRIYYIRKSLIPDLMKIGREMNERGGVKTSEKTFSYFLTTT